MLFVGLLLMLTLQRIHYKWFIPLIPLFAFASALMMVYVMFFGDVINGARRSFSLFGVMIQPAEFLKLSAAMVIALVMSRNQMPHGVKTRGVAICAATVIIFGGLLFNQGLTNTILLMSISLSMMLIGGVQWKKFGIVLIAYGVIAAGALWWKMESAEERAEKLKAGIKVEQMDGNRHETIKTDRSGTWQARIDRFLGDSVPKYDKPITADNRQEMYAYMAQANGGLLGVFPGNSREAARLPLAFSDYIYSIIIEDMGFVGGMFVLILYLWLLARAGAIARRCSRAFLAMLVIGMAVMIVFQALFHMAIVTGVFPVSGQPLPLISKGGSSILITSIAFGVMLSVSRYAVRSGKKQEIKQEMNALPESVRADNPTQI
jgi:cell division protein FtsW